MPIKQLNPYLSFNGTAAKAIKHYERALGAKTENLMHFGDVEGMTVLPEHRDRIMHAMLRIDDGAIMVSDTMPDKPTATEGNIEVCLNFDDVEDMVKRFEALAAGGKVTTPLQDVFWGATFGAITDAFGIRWLMNCNKKA